MQRMWVPLRENITCGNKLSDVICHLKMPTKQKGQGPHKKIDVHIGNHVMVKIANRQQDVALSCFEELDVGDPSRKVIEIILAAYLTNPMKKILKIRRVLKVKNSHKVAERFEKYRDKVKQKAKEREENHPRSSVDGNELLGFYVTTMPCHSRQSKWISGPCQDPICCNVCRTFEFISSNIEKTRFGIKLCMSSEALSESFAEVSKGRNVKRAVIICRIIAGKTRSIDDKTSEDEYDSIRKRGFCPNSEYLILNNPNAVLPCFVVVLN